MSDVLLTLSGELDGAPSVFAFSISTAAHDRLERRFTYRFAELDLIGRDPQLQPVGPGRDEILLTGTVYPHWRGGLYQVETLRGMARAGGSWLMIDGAGRLLGSWAILSVDEEASALIETGQPLRQRFRLALQYRGEAT